MNKDLTSDIKQVERFMFDNSVYLLNMFEKKIDSFVSTKTKKQRDKELSIARQENNRIDPNTFFDDPIKGLARDLTKPIWNCVVKTDPVVYVDNGDWWESHEQMSEEQETNITSPYRHIYTSLIKHFIHRYKTEHEDESNLKINSFYCNRESNLLTLLNIEEREILESQRPLTRELFGLLMRCIERENEFLESLPDLGEVEENYRYLRATLEAYSEVIGGYLEEEDMERAKCSPQVKELDWYLEIAMHAVISVLDSRCGSTLFAIQPRIGLTNLLIHPFLITIHNVLSIQFRHNEKERYLRDQNHHRHHNEQQKQNLNPKELMEVEDDMVNHKKPATSVKDIFTEQTINIPEEKYEVVFEELKYTNCSRIAFINLDGFESEYNLDVVKYLARNLMYVSFPKESSNKLESNTMKEFEQYKSERLLRKFFYQSLTVEEKKELLKLHAIEEREFKRNMFVLPVHSRALSEKYELLYDTNGIEMNSIEFYESTFIKFMFEEVILSHLRDYSPSMIILSYSGKVHIENEYFVELIKQLTVISNFRLLLNVNHGKMFCFEEKGEKVVAGEDFFNEEQKYYEMYEKNRINVLEVGNNTTTMTNILSPNNSNPNIDLDFLDKLSIFLKVSSGTYTLSKSIEEDSYIEKYKNYKIMRYSALLLKHIAKEYTTIEKLKMRSNEYLTISKVLKNQYAHKSETFDKLFEKVITKYHDNLIKVIEKLIFLDQSIFELTPAHVAQFNEEELMIITSCIPLLKKLAEIYEYLSKKEIWEDFKFQYKLELSTEKTENRFYLHVPKFKDSNRLYEKTTKNLEDLIICVEFEIHDEKEKLSVELTPNSKILYTKKRLFKEALIYVTNHVPKLKATNYFSFCGVVNETIDQKSELKVHLKPITFFSNRKLSSFQHYVDFNYFETPNFVFLFWPRVFDDVKDKISRVIGEKYVAESTWDMFRASRSEPEKLMQLNVVNFDTYQYLRPRQGCTCYQPFENINRFYIFGGFYNNEENYLNFQTDVSFVDFLDETNDTKVLNLPKQFYITQDVDSNLLTEKGTNNVFVKEFKNDFIRPRIEFEVYEPEKQLDETKKEVFLIGGVGEKFMRPFSLISYMGNKLTFNMDCSLQSIKRIKTNNLLPVNLTTPTKSRSPQEMNVITNAQNRNVYINEGAITQESLIISHYRYFYDHNEEKFDFEQVYEFADLEKRNYREETQCLRRAPTEYPIKYELMACSFRGKEFYNNFIKVSSENGKRYIFELMLELSMEVKNTYQNYQKIVRLTGASILAIDINASMLYCMIKHPSYTLDKCILAHFDINDLSGKLIDTKSVEIHLKEIHKFDCDVSKNIIIVLNSNTVAVLHGYRFNNDIEIPEMILKKYRKNQIKTLQVKSSQEQSTILSQEQLTNTHIVNEISSSFFINQNSGIILCLTFKSIDRVKVEEMQQGSVLVEKVYLRVERLDMTKEEYRWRLVNEKVYSFRVGSGNVDNNNNINNANINNNTKRSEETIGLQTTHDYSSTSSLEHITIPNDIINTNTIHSNTNMPLPPQTSTGKKNYIKLIEIRPNKESKEKKEKEFLIKATFNEELYNANINLDSINEMVEFTTTNQTEEQYYKSIYKDNIKQESIYLEKNPYFYQEVKEMAEVNYESMRSISERMNNMELEEGANGNMSGNMSGIANGNSKV